MTKITCLLAIALLLSGCPWDNEHNDYIRAKVDGKPMEFRVEVDGGIGGNDGRLEYLEFGALSSTDQTKPAMMFDLQTPGKMLVPGTYSTRNTAAEHPRAGEDQTDGFMAQYYYQRPNSTVVYMSDNEEITDFVIHFTALGKHRVKGTFSGQVRDSSTDRVLTLTDGSFSVPLGKH